MAVCLGGRVSGSSHSTERPRATIESSTRRRASRHRWVRVKFRSMRARPVSVKKIRYQHLEFTLTKREQRSVLGRQPMPPGLRKEIGPALVSGPRAWVHVTDPRASQTPGRNPSRKSTWRLTRTRKQTTRVCSEKLRLSSVSRFSVVASSVSCQLLT